MGWNECHITVCYFHFFIDSWLQMLGCDLILNVLSAEDSDWAVRLKLCDCWLFFLMVTESWGWCTLTPDVSRGRPRLPFSPSDVTHPPTTEVKLAMCVGSGIRCRDGRCWLTNYHVDSDLWIWRKLLHLLYCGWVSISTTSLLVTVCGRISLSSLVSTGGSYIFSYSGFTPHI